VAREVSRHCGCWNDNFPPSSAGVEEAPVYENIRRFTNYVLASNVPEIVPYLLYIVLPVPAGAVRDPNPIDRRWDQIWCRRSVLGQEPPQPDAMKRAAAPPGATAAGRTSALAQLPVPGAHAGRVLPAAVSFWLLHLNGWQYGERLEATDPRRVVRLWGGRCVPSS